MRPDPSTENLSIATPERVALDLPIAGAGHRTLAYLVDFLCLAFFWAVAFFALSFVVPDMELAFSELSGLGKVLLITGLFVTQWGYWTVAEVLWNGRTLGKRAVGIRVARHDGAPVGVLESAVRNLCRAVDFLPAFYAVGLVSMLVDRKGRRLGDILAGTVLLREERIDLDRYAAAPAQASPVTALAAASGGPLPAPDVELILSFLGRASTLEPEARERLARAMVERYGAHLGEEQRRQLAASREASEAFLRQRAQARG